MLVDTNIFVDFLKGNLYAKRFIEEEKNLSTSILTVMEVVAGLPKKNQIKSFEKFLDEAQIRVLQINETVSTKAYLIFSQFHHKISTSIPDALIAATAIIYNERLATLNTKHFPKIADLTVIKPY